jgi:uncharacterized membrane protein YbhN (UPF0104 family)
MTSLQNTAPPLPPAAPRRSRLFDFLGAGISVICLAAVVVWASHQEAPKIPSSAGRIVLLGVAIAAYALPTLVRGLRWHMILRRAGIEHDRKDAYGLVVVGYMGNATLPARGGVFVRIVLMSRRTTAGMGRVTGTVIAERVLDATAFVLMFGAFTLLNVGGAPLGKSAAAIGIAGLGLGAVGMTVYLRLRARGRLERLGERLSPFTRPTRTLFNPGGLALLVLSAGIAALDGFVFWLVAQSLALGISIYEAVALVVLVGFSSMIPAGPGYVGTYDAAVAIGLKAIDITGGRAVGFTVLARFVIYVPITVLGLVLVAVRYGGLRELRRSRVERERRELEAAVGIGKVNTS